VGMLLNSIVFISFAGWSTYIVFTTSFPGSSYLQKLMQIFFSSGSEADVDQRKLNASHMWFTWCQTCRHGGHAKHMLEWFEEHTECPVNNCDCNCMSLDSVK
jgi:hypothetical protein